MMGLPTSVASRISSTVMPAIFATSAASAHSASRTAAVMAAAPPGFIME